MASSAGQSLSYSRASAEDDDGHSNVSRSRSGDDRDQRKTQISPDPDEKKQFMDVATRERQRYDQDLRLHREGGVTPSAKTDRPGICYPSSRSPSTSHRGVLPETFRIDTPPTQSGRLRATPSASPRTSSTPASPFVMVEEDRPSAGVPPRPTSKTRSSSGDLLRQVQAAASDMTASQRAQMMRILAATRTR